MTKAYEVEFRLAGQLESSFRKTITDAANDYKKLTDAAKKLEKGSGKSSLTQPVREDLKRTQSEMRNTESASHKMRNVLSKSLLPLTAGLGAGAVLASSLNKSIDFEAQLDSIQAVSGMATSEMKKVHDLALKEGARTKYSALEAAQGMEEMIKAGLSAQQVLDGGLAAALNMAAAGEIGLADSAEIMSTALNAFKKDGLEASKVADILAGTANASATGVMELKMSLSQASAVASGVGMKFKDTNVALGVFANNGLKGSDAGTSLKTMLLNLSPITADAQSEFERLGLTTFNATKALEFLERQGVKPASKSTKDIVDAMMTFAAKTQGAKVGSDKANKSFREMAFNAGAMSSEFYDANGNLQSLDHIAGALRKSLSALTSEQRQVALKTMFGTDAIRAANILYEEGADGVRNFTEEMSKVTALDVAKKRMDNAKGGIEQFRGAMETLQISVLEPTLPLIKDLALQAADASEQFQSWMNTRQAKAWGNTLLSVLKAAPKMIGVTAAAMAAVKVGQGVNKTANFIKGLGKVQEAGSGAAKGIALLGRAATFLTNPVGMAVGAVGLLTAGVIAYKRHNENARQSLIHMKDSFDTAFSDYSAIVEHRQKTKDLIAEYDRLNTKIQDSKTPSEELTTAREKLADIEQQLIDLNPDIIKSESAKTDKLREQAELADRLNDAKEKMGRIELQKTVTDNIAKRPQVEKEYSKLKSDVPKYESEYEKQRADYVLYNDFIARQNEVVYNTRLSLHDQQAQLETLLNELENTTGKSYLGNWNNVYEERDALYKSYQDNYENWQKASEELQIVEQSYLSMYDAAKKYHEQETKLEGTLEDQAKRYQFMTDEQKKHFQEAFDKVSKLRQEMNLLPAKTTLELEVIQKTSGITPKPAPSDVIPEPFRLKIPHYADGDIVNKPHVGVYGEAGPEAFIPINNKPRSHAILDRVNQMMGRTEQQPRSNPLASDAASFGQRAQTSPVVSGPPITIENKSSVVVQGNADSSTIKLIEQALQKSNEDFARKIEAYFRQKGRVSMSGPV
ncbi:hypothetical protein BVG16_16340 [Paenibacillus selenitireducens]|uniref:Phage tail tape measure protein domain-containing protein n=1 Tax=Paenibacillus selenitireducens TaxID=1324314 RepID=A0A1T2XA08_9BACL|nr:phage tail tape measure protein [Paenibacillus selenitireducens]OPA76739.1 hypothetical protein BVG16_16340 [Paenibacillus selenitireducens]